MMYTPIDRFLASGQALEVLNHALGEIDDIYTDDPAMNTLFRDLETLVWDYEKHHAILSDEARCFENEEQGLSEVI